MIISIRVAISILVLTNLLMFQFGLLLSTMKNSYPENVAGASPPIENHRRLRASSSVLFPLATPQGNALALPSIRLSDDKDDVQRKFYGGKGDKAHLGGFTDIDMLGISPAVWRKMITYFGVKSVLDVGCGRGTSTSWFHLHGVDVQCVEGSHDAIEKSMIPLAELHIVEHDFSRGPWWPSRTYDAVWCVEFLEHVGRNFHVNYVPAFRKSALIFVTHSRWGGWHHVEVHDDTWWIAKFQSYGFVFSPDLTSMVKNVAIREKDSNLVELGGKPYDAQHIRMSMKVFINPAVASLPEHAHLFAEDGCYKGRKNGEIIHDECGVGAKSKHLTRIPQEFRPLPISDKMHRAWLDLVSRNVDFEKEETL